MIEVCQLPDGANEAWDAYVYRCPEASHCHLSGWGRLIERSYGHRAFYLWAWANGGDQGHPTAHSYAPLSAASVPRIATLFG